MSSHVDNAVHAGHFEPLQKTLQEHREALDEIQSSVTQPLDPVFTSDPTLTYRFYKGWKYDVPTAVQHINTAQAYRQTHNLNDIRSKAIHLTQQQFPHADRVLKYWPHVILHGEDKQGQPLSIERLGHSDPTVLCQVVSLDELMLYHHYHMENKAHLFAELSTRSDRVMRACKIMDLQGLGKQHLTKKGFDYFRSVVSASQDNYPETMGSLFVINAPWVFPIAWKTVSSFLAESVKSKIHILGSDYQSVLQQYIDKQYIPKEFGGDCTCGGKGCVPLYNPEEDMTKVHIRAGSKHDYSLPLPSSKRPHLLSYQFRMHSHDIAFSIHIVRSTGSTDVLVKSERMGSGMEVRDGVMVEGEGEVKVTFDNGYSRFTSKTLWFRVDLQELGEQEVAASREIAQEEEKRSPRAVEGPAAGEAAKE